MSTITDDDKENILISCRYGDLEEIQQFVTKFGRTLLSDVRDENGNSVLHMTAGNGHTDILEYLLPIIAPSLLGAQNNSGSTPLHWAVLNSHLPIVQKLIQFPGGPGIDLIDIKNKAGRSPLGEAECAGWEEGATWLVQMMKLDAGDGPQESVDSSEDLAETGQDIQVEIEDADGQIARMTLGGV